MATVLGEAHWVNDESPSPNLSSPSLYAGYQFRAGVPCLQHVLLTALRISAAEDGLECHIFHQLLPVGEHPLLL